MDGNTSQELLVTAVRNEPGTYLVDINGASTSFKVKSATAITSPPATPKPSPTPVAKTTPPPPAKTAQSNQPPVVPLTPVPENWMPLYVGAAVILLVIVIAVLLHRKFEN